MRRALNGSFSFIRLSYQEAKNSHVQYEKLRAIGTPLVERQKLFESMAQPWENIAVPKDVLVPQSLHQVEVIKNGKRPRVNCSVLFKR